MFKTKLRNVSMAILALVLSLSVVLGLANLKTNVANAATYSGNFTSFANTTASSLYVSLTDPLALSTTAPASDYVNFSSSQSNFKCDTSSANVFGKYIGFSSDTDSIVVTTTVNVSNPGVLYLLFTNKANLTDAQLSGITLTDGTGTIAKKYYTLSNTVANPVADSFESKYVANSAKAAYLAFDVTAGTSTITFSVSSMSISGNQKFQFTALEYVESATEPEPATTYAITCDNSIENGSVSCDVEKAEEGATVTVTASPNTGYECVDISVDGESVVGEGAVRTFIMPAKAVTVSAQFAKIPVSSVTLEAEGALPALADVKEKEGYTFVGWSASGTLYSAEEVAPAGDYTAAYAKTVAHGIGLCKSVEAIRYSFEIKIVDFEDTAIADIDSTEFINAVFTLELNAGDAEGIKGAEKSYETPNIAYCKDEDYDGYRINVVLVGNFDTYIDCAVDANLTSINLNGVKLSCDGILTAEDTMENIISQLLISEYLTNAEAEMYGYIFEE